MSTVVGIVGKGSISSVLVRGWLCSPAPKSGLLVYRGQNGSNRRLSGVADATTGLSPNALAKRVDVFVLDTEPSDALNLLLSMRGSFGSHQMIVSAAAGVSLKSLRETVDCEALLFRAVGHPSIEPGEGMTLICPEPGVSAAAVDFVGRLFAHSGAVEFLPESLLDTATALMSASSRCLALALAGVEDGAVGGGLSRESARTFVRQTALASARLLQSSAASPADLKDQVASPAGTTIAGLAVLEGSAVRGAFMQAVAGAAERSRNPQDADGPPVVE